MSQRTTAARYSGASALSAAWMSPSRCRSSNAWAGVGSSPRSALRRVVAQPLEPDALPAPGHVQEQVGGDPVQPALEGARRVAGQRAEDADEDLLGEVLGVVGVAGQPVGQPVDPGGVLTHDLFPGRRRPARMPRRAWSRACPRSRRPAVCHLPLPPWCPGIPFPHHNCSDSALRRGWHPAAARSGRPARFDQRCCAVTPSRQHITPEQASLVPGSRRVTIGCRTGISMHRKAHIVSAEANLAYVEGFLTEDEPLLAARREAAEIGGATAGRAGRRRGAALHRGGHQRQIGGRDRHRLRHVGYLAAPGHAPGRGPDQRGRRARASAAGPQGVHRSRIPVQPLPADQRAGPGGAAPARRRRLRHGVLRRRQAGVPGLPGRRAAAAAARAGSWRSTTRWPAAGSPTPAGTTPAPPPSGDLREQVRQDERLVPAAAARSATGC